MSCVIGCEETPPEPLPAPDVAAVQTKESPSSAAVEKKSVRTEDSCALICEQAKIKNCPISEAGCAAACQEMTASPQCTKEMQVVLSCMAQLEATAWTCGDTGFPEVTPGHCEVEQEAMVKCLGAEMAQH